MKTDVYEIGFSRRFTYHCKTWQIELPVESDHLYMNCEEYVIDKINEAMERIQKEIDEVIESIQLYEEE